MARVFKAYDKLTFTDNFMFVKIMSSHPELCRETLELILDMKIGEISTPGYEVTKDLRYDAKSIRLDVCAADDSNTVYDIEMQAVTEKYLPERSRYYHAVMDMEQLQKGDTYDELKNTYVIFILKNGLGPGYDRPVYTYSHRSDEDDSKYLNDRAWTILVNAACEGKDLSYEMRSFLGYVRDGRVPEGDEGLPSKLDAALKEARRQENWRDEYMNYRMFHSLDFKEAREEGRAEGRAEGLEEGRAEGLEAGRAEGLEIGKAMIRNLHNNGMTIEEIAKLANIQVEEIEELLKDNEG